MPTGEMRYRLLGHTGLRVSELCLGAMLFGPGGAPPDEAGKIVRRFADAGGNFIDTANRYGGGESERIVGDLIRPDRDRWVLATKYTLSSHPDDPNAGGSHRKNMHRAVEASLQRLGTDYIDLYWVHVWDSFTPAEEVIRGLDDLVRSGKVLYVGVSDTPAWLVARAVTLAQERGLTPFSAIQIPYSLVERTVKHELLPMARALDLAVTGWAPGRRAAHRPLRHRSLGAHGGPSCSPAAIGAGPGDRRRSEWCGRGAGSQSDAGRDRVGARPAASRRDDSDHRGAHRGASGGQPGGAGRLVVSGGAGAAR